jgi:oxygen-independent coproporphyrinogen-3 oxidase
VGIPFCPSRCAYCSFVSHSIAGAAAQKLVPLYVQNLVAELGETGRLARALGLVPLAVYVGGGTPTALAPQELARVCGAIAQSFALPPGLEYTVEAGRPDTITREKLEILRAHGVNRLSVNPQTMRDEVLARAGRRHTARDCLESYALARRLGFDNINMDLIAGLPGDSPAGFCASLEQLIALRPENITVHTLAFKRAAQFSQQAQAGAAGIVEMLQTAQTLLAAAAYAPYYMYRQSRSLGNLENIGWSLPGRYCRYNIDMMEESHTILACGAGGVTKCKQVGTDYLERIFSLKYPYEYLSRFDELMQRKQRMAEFYRTYNNNAQ